MPSVTAIAEEDQAEQRRLDRLGLDVGDGDHERAVVHGREHRRGGDDLRAGAEHDPGPEHRRRHGQRQPGRHQHAGEKHQRERKAEQEAHMGGADGAERRGQLALHGVARGLAGGGQEREGNAQSQPVSAPIIPWRAVLRRPPRLPGRRRFRLAAQTRHDPASSQEVSRHGRDQDASASSAWATWARRWPPILPALASTVTAYDIAAGAGAALCARPMARKRPTSLKALGESSRSGHHHAAERPRGASRAAGGGRRGACWPASAPAASSSI